MQNKEALKFEDKVLFIFINLYEISLIFLLYLIKVYETKNI